MYNSSPGGVAAGRTGKLVMRRRILVGIFLVVLAVQVALNEIPHEVLLPPGTSYRLPQPASYELGIGFIELNASEIDQGVRVQGWPLAYHVESLGTLPSSGDMYELAAYNGLIWLAIACLVVWLSQLALRAWSWTVGIFSTAAR
jgi:hypothetical protein